MANSFSIEWLSKSFYTTPKDMDDDILQVTPPSKRRALGQNAPPETLLRTEVEEQGEEPRNQHYPNSPNNSCGYTSGSESEVEGESHSESARHRRMRTKFTSEQVNKLERTFTKYQYLGATQRRKVAEKLNLSETQVKTWFQNRRMKLKREVQDKRSEFIPAPHGLLLPFLHAAPSLQHQAGGQLPAFSHTTFSPHPIHTLPLHTPHIIYPQHIYPVMLTPSYF